MFAPYGSVVAIATFDGGKTWARSALPVGTPDVYTISCPTHSACVAAGSSTGTDANVTLLTGRLSALERAATG